MIPKTAGDLRTRVRVQFLKAVSYPGKPAAKDWVDIGNVLPTDPPKYKYCMWVGVHGTEAFNLGQDTAIDMATLTFRGDKRINTACRVVKGDSVYDIINVDHVRQIGQWTEIKIRRAVGG